MSFFVKSRWHSQRLGCEATVARWGEVGQPVLLFPTAGGDAEECERFLMIKALEPLLSAGRIKLYSPDSVAGQVWFDRGQHPGHRMWMQHQYHEWIRHEVVPAIYTDCKTTDIPIWTAGASIGAFHAAAAVCRSPDVFHRALSMSGTYNLMRFIEVDTPTEPFRWVSPLYVVPKLQGAHLDQLRTRFVQIVTGQGRWEDASESWRLANTLGAKGVPNHVDLWGPEWHHDWVTWREMLPQYLDRWTK